jgi:hypothetical protein
VESHLLAQRSRTFDIDRGFGITSKLAVITGAAAHSAAGLQRIAAAAAAAAGAGGVGSSSSGKPLPQVALQSKSADRAAAAAEAAKEAAAEQTKQDFAKWCRYVQLYALKLKL